MSIEVYMRITTLKEFYRAMFETRDIREDAVRAYFGGKTIQPDTATALEKYYTAFSEIPAEAGKASLVLEGAKTIQTDIAYERDELAKDILFLREGVAALMHFLEGAHKNFRERIDEGKEFLGNAAVDNFVSDRDGTVNNYCGRYASSIQSVYNAVFLAEYAKAKTTNAVILTSAPLIDIGLVNISVMPKGAYIYAASKGREYIDAKGRRKNFPIDEAQQKKLNELNKQIYDLLHTSDYERFSLIGSGLQFKFGQTTVARQDIFGSIAEEDSIAFMKTIEQLIADVDPDDEFFRIEDTGKDIEIILTVKGEGKGLTDFDKGNGVRFLNEDIPLRMENAVNLIAGDTGSDVPMAHVASEMSEQTKTIFVTGDEKLKKKVRSACHTPFFVETPDMLVALLYEIVGA